MNKYYAQLKGILTLKFYGVGQSRMWVNWNAYGNGVGIDDEISNTVGANGKTNYTIRLYSNGNGPCGKINGDGSIFHSDSFCLCEDEDK